VKGWGICGMILEVFMNFEYLENIRNMAIETYQVDPWIFAIIYIITIPVYYLGLFIMIEQGVKFYRVNKKLKKKFQINMLFSHKGFNVGFSILVLGWIIPYIYVLIFGKNIPLLIYLLIFGFFFLSLYLVTRKTHVKIIKKSKE
jgi:hypothetical protein